MIHKIGHGDLNKKAIEAFFKSMVDDPEVLNSRYFLFFLRADEEAFKKRFEDDFNWVKSMANKFSQNNDYEIKQMGLDIKENQPDLSQEEKKKLNIYVDTAERIEKKNTETFGKIGTLIKQVTKCYKALGESIFDLSQEFKKVAEGYKTLESISGKGLKTDFVKQGDLYQTLMDTCIECSTSIKRSGSNFERHIPPFLKVHDQNFQYLNNVSALFSGHKLTQFRCSS